MSKSNFANYSYPYNLQVVRKATQSSTQTTQLSAQTTHQKASITNEELEDIFLDIDEVVTLTGIKKRTIQDRCKKGKYITKTTVGRGGERYLIALDSLPLDDQIKYHDSNSSKSLGKESISKECLELTPVNNVSEAKNNRLAREREVVAEALAEPAKGIRDTHHKKLIATKHGIDLATLYRWIKKHTKSVNRIITKTANENDFQIDFSEFRKFTPAALDWAVGRRLKYPMESIDNTYAELQDCASKEGWKLGSLKRFYVAMGRIPEALIIASCEGRRGLDNKIAPNILRDLSQYKPLELVCGDQMISDYYCYNQNGEIVTPEFYAWIDMGTSMVVGLALTTGRYNKYLIGESLKQVCEFGIPKEIYTDNGKPELSKYLKDVLADLNGCSYTVDADISKIDRLHKKAKPRNSKAKPIESYFGHIQRKLLDITKGKGYKKYEKSESDLLRQKHLKKAIKNRELMSLEEFSTSVLDAVSWWNSHYNKSRRIVAEVEFYKGLEKNPRPQISKEALEYIFLPQKRYTVRNSSIIITFEHESCRFVSNKLSLYQGKKIDVRWSPVDLSKVYLLDNGKLIDIAIYKGKINPKSNSDVIRALNEKQAVIKMFEKLRESYVSKFDGKIAKITRAHTISKAISKKEKLNNSLKITADERDAMIDMAFGL